MSLSRYDISELIKKDLLPMFQDYKLVQTTRTTMIQLSSISNPLGQQTVVEYTIEKKEAKAEENC
jgi:hypothetical protein